MAFNQQYYPLIVGALTGSIAHNSANKYKMNSVVTDSGVAYRAKIDVPVSTLITSTTYWESMFGGNTVFMETTHPTSGDGVDGDIWIHDLHGDIFKKASGSWVSEVTLTPAITDTYVRVNPTTTDLLRATEFSDAVALAIALTPGGNALSATNRAMVLVQPGLYDFGTTGFTHSTEFVDIIGENNCGSVKFTGSGTFTFKLSANNCKMSNLYIQNSSSTVGNVALYFGHATTHTSTLLDNICFNRTVSGGKCNKSDTAYNGTYRDIRKGDDYSNYCFSDQDITSARFNDIEVGNYCFAYEKDITGSLFFDIKTGTHALSYDGPTGIATSQFLRIDVGDYSVAHSSDVGAGCNFLGVQADDYCFCSDEGAGTTGGTFAGTISDFTLDDYCMCYGVNAGGTFSGEMNDGACASYCVASSAATGGTVSGTVRLTRATAYFCGGGVTGGAFTGSAGNINCGSFSFGGGSTFAGTMSGAMRTVYMPTITEWNSTVTGYMDGCEVKVSTTNASAVLAGAGAQIHRCTLIANGTGYSITGTGAITYIHCALNIAVNGITSTISPAANAQNVTDASVDIG